MSSTVRLREIRRRTPKLRGKLHLNPFLILPVILSLGVLSVSSTAKAENEFSHPYASSQEYAEVQALRQAQADNASPVRLVLPYFSAKESTSVELLALSAVAHRLELKIWYRGLDGKEHSFGSRPLPSGRHISIPLAADSPNLEGTLFVEFQGDATTLQAWLVLQDQGQRTKLSLQVAELNAEASRGVREIVSYWSGEKDSEPIYAFFNPTARKLAFSGNVYPANGETKQFTATLNPGELHLLFPRKLTGSSAGSWFSVGAAWAEPGLMVSGLIKSPKGLLAHLPFHSKQELRGAREFHSAGVSMSGKTLLTVFNSAAESNAIELRLVDFISGAELASRTLELVTLEVATHSLSDLFPKTTNHSETRLIVEGEPGLAVSAFEDVTEGRVGISFFDRRHAHPNGRYMVPDLRTHEAVTTLTNLGSAHTLVGGQLNWEGGELVLGTWDIPPGGSRAIDLGAIVRDHYPEKQDVWSVSQALFQWTALQGDSQLIGRTETWIQGSKNRLGFNCVSCCWQIPFALILPSFVEVPQAGSPSFQAAFRFETCSTSLGPFFTSPTSIVSPSPFDWNGAHVSASSGGLRGLEFEGWALRISPGSGPACSSVNELKKGRGEADACDTFCNPQGFEATTNTNTCAAQTATCGICTLCCNALFKAGQCKRENSLTLLQGFAACRINCITDKNCTNIPPTPAPGIC